MLTLKSYTGHNLQSHVDVHLVFPETGLIRFIGDNSNGKSVMRKPITYLIEGKLRIPKIRKSLINRKATSCWATYERSDGALLTIHIALEARDTYVEYSIPGKAPLRRYLADKNIEQLLMMFGFHLLVDSNTSLNICDGDDSLLFFRTKHKLNYELIEPVVSDTFASKTIEVTEQLIQENNSTIKILNNKVIECDAVLSSLTIFPIEEEEKRVKRLRYLTANLERMSPPVIPAIDAVPELVLINVERPYIPDVKYPPLIDASVSIPDILGVAEEIIMLRNNTCPTCGRRWCDEH